MDGRKATPSSTAAANTPSTSYPKIKLEMVVADEMVDKVVQAILSAARSGKIGDGKIFVSSIDEAIRIRNDERGETAL